MTRPATSHGKRRMLGQCSVADREGYCRSCEDMAAGRRPNHVPTHRAEITLTVTIPAPMISTGPAGQTVIEAAALYLRDAAGRVESNRYWGSGVSALVARTLRDVADATEGVTA